MSNAIIAHHEAGHAVTATVLDIPFISVSIVPNERNQIGVEHRRMPWTSPRPEQKLNGISEEEWSELKQNDAKWEAWKRKENDEFAIFKLAGKAAQIEYAGTARDEEANNDYSFVQNVLPHCYARLRTLEESTRKLVKGHWPAIQAVAAELLKKQKLTESEVKELVSQVEKYKGWLAQVKDALHSRES